MNRSPLHDLNTELGARFVDFGGWEMPVQYSSVLAEHRAVRDSVGVFDVTHLGRFELTGPGSHAAVRSLLCNDIDRVEPGRCQYTMILNASGGIIDDLIVWWISEDRFWVLPNAANHERVMKAFADREGCVVQDLQKSTVMLAVQGPDATDAIESVLGESVGRFRNIELGWKGTSVRLAGTGYTGEPGAEICADPEVATQLVEALVEFGVTPCGLGSRDTLRLEAGLPLWGEDIDESSTPLEAGLRFAVSLDHEFTGREPLQRQTEEGVTRLLTGFKLSERGVPRHGYSIRTEDGSTGNVTSGNMSPLLNQGIGLGYLAPPAEGPETRVEVAIRDKWVPGVVAKPPFHKE